MIHYQVPNLVARRLMYLETITVAYIRDAAIFSIDTCRSTDPTSWVNLRNRGRAFGHSSGLIEAGRGGSRSGDSRLRRLAALPLTAQARSSRRARAQQLRPLYLVCGRKIGRVGATDRPRPWSINKTAKKSLGRRALPLTTRKESPNSCLGHFVLRRRGEHVSARKGL